MKYEPSDVIRGVQIIYIIATIVLDCIITQAAFLDWLNFNHSLKMWLLSKFISKPFSFDGTIALT